MMMMIMMMLVLVLMMMMLMHCSREAKHRLEMDWSDKYSAQHLDSRSVNLKNTRGNIQRKSGKALYNVTESLPGDWQTFTDNNIRLAEQEREASIRLRGLIGSTLSNT